MVAPAQLRTKQGEMSEGQRGRASEATAGDVRGRVNGEAKGQGCPRPNTYETRGKCPKDKGGTSPVQNHRHPGESRDPEGQGDRATPEPPQMPIIHPDRANHPIANPDSPIHLQANIKRESSVATELTLRIINSRSHNPQR